MLDHGEFGIDAKSLSRNALDDDVDRDDVDVTDAVGDVAAEVEGE